MNIRTFADSDILQASKLAKLTWGDFYTHESQELQDFIYNFMVEYYDLNREFSFSILDNGELKGLLLAFKKNDIHNTLGFAEKVKVLKEKNEQKTALDLIDYLEACTSELGNIIDDNDVVLGLFASAQKGCGRQLLAKLGETCAKKNIKNICLWTDTTCNFEYYRKNNFVLLKEIESSLNGKFIKTLIYKKSV